MSCNGCRVLRKGCGENCVLRSSLHWIPTPQAQGNATLFLAKFFGRSDLLSFISAVPESQRPALFQSLLFEACGRTVNPVNGAVGLLWSGNWRVCQAAVETVLAGGSLQPVPGIAAAGADESSDSFSATGSGVGRSQLRLISGVNENHRSSSGNVRRQHRIPLFTPAMLGGSGRGFPRLVTGGSCYGEESETTTAATFESTGGDRKKLLNLFV